MSKLTTLIDRFRTNELSLGTADATQALWNVLSDPDEWSLETLSVLEQLAVPLGSARTETGVLRFERPSVVVGDLVVNGDVEVLSHTLVLGNLTCSGYLYSGVHDCLIVTGEVSGRALEALRSYWLIGGGVRAETAFLSTYGFLLQRGEVRVRLLVLQQAFELQRAAAVFADTMIDTDYLPKDDAARRQLASVLDVEELIDANGQFNSWALLRKASQGLPLLRPAAG